MTSPRKPRRPKTDAEKAREAAYHRRYRRRNPEQTKATYRRYYRNQRVRLAEAGPDATARHRAAARTRERRYRLKRRARTVRRRWMKTHIVSNFLQVAMSQLPPKLYRELTTEFLRRIEETTTACHTPVDSHLVSSVCAAARLVLEKAEADVTPADGIEEGGPT